MIGVGMRTIWISLRAINYTDRAFRAAIGNLDTLNKEEKKHLKNMLQMKEVARLNVQVGMLYAAMAGMMAQQLFGLVSATAVGAEYMVAFNQTLNDAKIALADTFFEILKPVLDVFKGFLELVRDNAPLRILVTVLAGLATVLLGLYGIYKLLIGIYEGIRIARKLNNFLVDHELIVNKQLVASNQAVTASSMTLGTALMYVGTSLAIGFGLFFALRDVLGDLPAMLIAVAAALVPLVIMLWKAAVATSIVTSGIAAIIGLAAIGGALGIMNMGGIGNFQRGIRSAPYTGPMMVHKGEVIYNPYSGRPTGVAAEIGRETVPSVTHQDIDINVEHLYTEAPYDEIDEKLGETARRKMRNSR